MSVDMHEWRMVPVEPTQAMEDAGVHAGVNASPKPWCPAAWTAMLAAAPDPWQRIDENTPKDQRMVLAYFGPDKDMDGFMAVGHLFQWEKMKTPMACNWPSGYPGPSHWMPLPPRPKA